MQGSGFRVQGLGFRLHAGFRVQHLRIEQYYSKVRLFYIYIVYIYGARVCVGCFKIVSIICVQG